MGLSEGHLQSAERRGRDGRRWSEAQSNVGVGRQRKSIVVVATVSHVFSSGECLS